MSNANTIVYYKGAGTVTSSTASRNQILTQTGTGTTETVFTQGNDAAATTVLANLALPVQTGIVGANNPFAVGANPAILTKGNQQYGPVLGSNAPYFTSDSFNGRPFKVRFSGTFTSGVASNDLKIGLYNGTSATVGSDSAVFVITTGTSANFGAVSGHFFGEAILIWDITTGKLDGNIGTNQIAPSGVAATVTAGGAITQISAAAISNINFLLSYKWNASNAGNTISVAEFSIEAV